MRRLLVEGEIVNPEQIKELHEIAQNVGGFITDVDLLTKRLIIDVPRSPGYETTVRESILGLDSTTKIKRLVG